MLIKFKDIFTHFILFSGEYDSPKAALEYIVKNNIRLQTADLTNLNLMNAKLSKGSFRCCDFSDCYMNGVDLSYSDCQGANFANANFENGNINYMDAREAQFSCCNMTNTKQIGVIIDG